MLLSPGVSVFSADFAGPEEMCSSPGSRGDMAEPRLPLGGKHEALSLAFGEKEKCQGARREKLHGARGILGGMDPVIQNGVTKNHKN